MNRISFIFISIVLFVACSQPRYEPTFAVCTKITNYPAVAAAGYDYVEPSVGDFLMPDKSDGEFEENLKLMSQTGTKIISCVNFIPAKLKIVGDETLHDEIIVWATTVFERAKKANIPYIVFGSGGARRVPDGFDKQEATAQFTGLCKKLAPIAQKNNVIVVIEPLNTAETNLINSLKEGAEIVKAVNHPNVQLLCDIYHMMRDNEPAGEIVKYGSYIKHCHIAEKETRSAPGTKEDDFTEYFKALKQINYQGCVSIEARWENFEQQFAPALQYMKQQFASL